MQELNMNEVEAVSAGALTAGESAAAVIAIVALPATGMVAFAALVVCAIAWM